MKELVILFIPQEEQHWIEDSSGEFYKIPAGLDSSSDRALLVVEDRMEEDAPFTEAIQTEIEEAIGGADRVYVALHGGSPHSEAHEEMIGTSRASAVETYHRSPGDHIYEAFCRVIEGIQSEPETLGDNTSEALGDLIDQLGPDWKLETKLELLHRCLTPEGAESVKDHSENLRKELQAYRAGCMDSELVRPVAKSSNENGDTSWDVKDVVSALARDPNGDKIIEFDDSSDSSYQEALSVMRDTLLQEQ